MRGCSKYVMGFCLAALLISAQAQAARQGTAVYFDQDLLLPLVNEDRDYTMGIGIERFEQDEAFYPFEEPLKYMARLFSIDVEGEGVRRSYMFGSLNYTPDDLSASTPVPGDRPYASFLYLANKRVLADRRRAIGAELQLGLLGTYVAREVQRKIHRKWREASNSQTPVDPRGWGSQISAGGEPTAALRIARSDWLAGRPGRWDLASTVDLSLGYRTNASAGLALRGGLIGSPFWSLPYDPINRGNFIPAFGEDELYLWGAARARTIAYDALLQGQFRDSALSYASDEIRHLVLDAGAGITGGWRGMQLTFSVNLKTSEITHGTGDRTQWWGGLYLTVSH